MYTYVRKVENRTDLVFSELQVIVYLRRQFGHR